MDYMLTSQSVNIFFFVFFTVHALLIYGVFYIENYFWIPGWFVFSLFPFKNTQ